MQMSVTVPKNFQSPDEISEAQQARLTDWIWKGRRCLNSSAHWQSYSLRFQSLVGIHFEVEAKRIGIKMRFGEDLSNNGRAATNRDYIEDLLSNSA